ncbi:hypothetical protein [Rhodomicrobium sp.]|uniref:hypothetical protein n=1 Tax=Rhodomicrobium sp. TaxID=2720632 RepID=UPI0039E4BE7C
MNDFPAGHSSLYQFLYYWQTLISGVLALIAAIITIMKLSEQIQVQERQHTETRQSKAWAARAMLLLCLSAISKYTSEMALWLLDNNRERPNSPDEVIKILVEKIEFLPANASKKIFEIIKQYQIMEARTRTRDRQTNDHIYEFSYLRALADSLFEFAREETNQVQEREPTRDNMVCALDGMLGLDRYHHQHVYDQVLERINRAPRHA